MLRGMIIAFFVDWISCSNFTADLRQKIMKEIPDINGLYHEVREMITCIQIALSEHDMGGDFAGSLRPASYAVGGVAV